MRMVPYVAGGAGISWATAIAIVACLIAVGVVYTFAVTLAIRRREGRIITGEIHEVPEPRPLLRKVA